MIDIIYLYAYMYLLYNIHCIYYNCLLTGLSINGLYTTASSSFTHP